MDLFGAPFSGSAGSALFVGASSATGVYAGPDGVTGTVVWPTGTQVGDMALIRAAHYNTYGPPVTWPGSTQVTETWTGDGDGNTGRLQWKVLTSGDLASPPSWSAYGIAIMIYRGPTSVAFKGVVNYTSDPVADATIPAFAPDNSAMGAVSFLNSSANSGFLIGGVQRLTFSEPFTSMIGSDLLAYTGGSLVWTGAPASSRRHASVYELT